MRSRFMSGVIAGGLLGATMGMYALNKTSPRQRKKMMKRGVKAFRNASKIADAVSAIDMFK